MHRDRRCTPRQKGTSSLGTSLSERLARRTACLPQKNSGQQWPQWRLPLAALPWPGREKVVSFLALWGQNTDPKYLILATYHLGTWPVKPAVLVNSHLHFYPELPCRGLESMGVKYKVVPSFTCDWGAIAKRPLRQCGPFVGSNIQWHMAWSCNIRGRKVSYN